MSSQIRQNYLTVGLYVNNKRVTISIHILVAKTFLKNTDPEKTQVDHIDGIKINNHVSNLRYATPSENIKNAFRNNKNMYTVKSVVKMDLDNNIIEKYDSIKLAAEKNNLARSHISSCCTGNRKTCGGFKWSYAEKTKEIKLETDEKFKKIDEIKGNFYNAYEVSNHGKIRNIKTNRFLKPKTSDDYNRIILYDINGKSVIYYIHFLVAYFFIEKNNDSNLVVNHIDEDKKNNDYRNLDWVTLSENAIHSMGRKICKINLESQEILNTYSSIVGAARELKKKKGDEIMKCCKNIRKSAYGFAWKYFDDVIKLMIESGYVEIPIKNLKKYKKGTTLIYIKNDKLKNLRILEQVDDNKLIYIKNGKKICTLFSDIEKIWVLKK
jgi:hypothetical protein